MARILLFNALLLLACGYALWRGGGPEKAVAALFLLAAITTRLIGMALAERFARVELQLLAIDLLLLVGLIAVALRADRFWTMTVAAMQVIAVGVHAAKLLSPEFTRWVYAVMLAVWSYPMLVLLVLATWRHRQRLIRNGVDPSWSGSSPRLRPTMPEDGRLR
jgi:uncharacterized membrane protein YfcA